jgi:adenosylhomocysteine nucleosidase
MKERKVIGILCAMSIELNRYLELYPDYEVTQICCYKFYSIKSINHQLILAICGIGKINAAVVASLLMEHFKPDYLVNTGIAGGMLKDMHPLDLVVATSIYSSDCDQTSDITQDLAYGQLQGLPECYLCDESIIKQLKALNTHCIFASIASGDQFQVNYDVAYSITKKYKNDPIIGCFDMESFSIAQVAYLFKTPVLVIRAISDVIGSSSKFDYEKFAPLSADKSVDYVIEYLLPLLSK